jgi:hypothetical protein
VTVLPLDARQDEFQGLRRKPLHRGRGAESLATESYGLTSSSRPGLRLR